MVEKLSELRRHIHIFGIVSPPGGGKKTKGKIIKALLGEKRICTFEMSELLDWHRRHKEDSDIGKDLVNTEEIQGKGKLLPDVPAINVFKDAVISAYGTNAQGVWADGFPRSVPQADYLLKCKVPFTIFHFDIDEDTSVQRINLRAKKEGRRSDDESAKYRYQTYMRETRPAIGLIRSQRPATIVSINGTAPIRTQIVKILRTMMKCGHIRYSDFGRVVCDLDRHSHPVWKMIDDIENPKPILAPRVFNHYRPVQVGASL